MYEQELEKWGNYFRYFYFYEDMTFEDFLKDVANGFIPKRKKVDWSLVKAPYDEGKNLHESGTIIDW